MLVTIMVNQMIEGKGSSRRFTGNQIAEVFLSPTSTVAYGRWMKIFADGTIFTRPEHYATQSPFGWSEWKGERR